jgi:large subunit ribosomal protein L4
MTTKALKVKVVSLEGEASESEISVIASIFGLDIRKDILHRVVNWQLAKRQAGTHKAKNRNEVSGSTRKLFRQKGTGNARTGDARSPHKRGGGACMGPVVRSHAHSLPKKIRALGLKIALSSKLAGGKLLVLNDDNIKESKTSVVSKKLKELNVKSALIIGGEQLNDNLKNAVSNIREVDLISVRGANVYDILRRDNLLITKDAVKILEERLNG